MATKFLEPGTDATQGFTFFLGTNTTNGTIASDSTQSKTGPRSIKSNVTVANGNAFTWTPNGTISDAGAVISIWVRFSSVAPSIATFFVGAEQASNGGGVLGIALNTNGTLQVKGKGATGKSGSTVLSANTWYRITLIYLITSSTNWSATTYINGVSEVSTGNADGTLTAVTSSGVKLGIAASSIFGSTSSILTVWIDNIYVDNTQTEPGNVLVTAKRPNANGTTNGFVTQIGVGGSGYGTGHSPQVNEQPLNTANGWSINAVAATTEEYNIEGTSAGDVDISAATLVDYMGWVYTKAGVAETGQIIVNNVTTNISITTANKLFTQVAGSTTYPAGTGTDIGEITSATLTTVSLYECGIIFAYKSEVITVDKWFSPHSGLIADPISVESY